MKYLLALITSHLIMYPSYGQNGDFKKPNYQQIEKNIEIKSSNLYYPELMERYQTGDSTLTLEEKRHLYYGYIYQDNYSPYGHSDYADSLRPILQKERHSTEELNKIIEFSDSLLVENPFDLDAINYQLYAFEQQEDDKFNAKINQMRIVVDALISSGDGTTKKNAFYVIYTSHEYALLDILGFQFGGAQSLTEHYDYLELVENDANVKGLYFDVKPCLNSLSNMFK